MCAGFLKGNTKCGPDGVCPVNSLSGRDKTEGMRSRPG
jgi:hypothetical protein